MADPRSRFAYALLIGCLAFAPAAPAVATAQDAPVLIDGWKIDFDNDRCYMVRSTGDGQQGIEFQLLDDGSNRLLFMRDGWPQRTGAAASTITIAGERIAKTARLSVSEDLLLVSFEIEDALIEALASGAAVGLEVPELSISASFDLGTITEARQNLYDCAMVML